MKKISFFLIGTGIFMMLNALFMNTSRSGYHNIGLLSNQQTLVIFGGFLFIGGIALFGFSQTRHTNSELNNLDGENSTNNNREEITEQDSKNFESKLVDSFPKWDDSTLKAKVITGLASSLPFAIPAAVINPLFGLILIAAIITYSVRGQDSVYNTLYVMSGLFFVISGLFIIFSLIYGNLIEGILISSVPAVLGESFRIALKTRTSST